MSPTGYAPSRSQSVSPLLLRREAFLQQCIHAHNDHAVTAIIHKSREVIRKRSVGVGFRPQNWPLNQMMHSRNTPSNSILMRSPKSDAGIVNELRFQRTLFSGKLRPRGDHGGFACWPSPGRQRSRAVSFDDMTRGEAWTILTPCNPPPLGADACRA